MKIAQVVCVYPPYKGGIGNMASHHATFLAAQGHDVHVFTPAYEGKEEVVTNEGVTVHLLKPFIAYGNAGLLPQLYTQLQGFDIVHLHYPFFGGAEVVWRLKKKMGNKMKLVVTYHMDVVGNLITRSIFWLHKLFVLPRIIGVADSVIVTSNDYAAHSYIKKQFYTMPNLFIDIPPEVDIDHFSPKDFSEIQQRHDIADDEKVILFVGGLDPAHYFKGVDVLIRAFAALKQTSAEKMKLVIVGKGSLKDRYEAMARNKGLGSDVIFAGGVSNDELPQYYSMADVTVLPSIDKSEAFGIVLLESLACETPVIASNLPGVRTALIDGVDGYVVGVENEGELASRIRDILSNETKALEKGRRGRGRVVAQHATNVIGNQLQQLYEDLRR